MYRDCSKESFIVFDRYEAVQLLEIPRKMPVF